MGAVLWHLVWPGGVMAKTLDLQCRGRKFDSWLLHYNITTLGKLFTCVFLSPGSINWYWSHGIGTDALHTGGSRRSDIALAVCHRLKWFIHVRAQGLNEGDEHPAFSHSLWSMALYYSIKSRCKECGASEFRIQSVCGQRNHSVRSSE